MIEKNGLRLNRVLFDWFTVTSFERSFRDYWREEIAALDDAGEPTQAKKLRRYLGENRAYATGHVFLGDMEQIQGQHYAAIMEGEAADLMRRHVRFSLENHNARITRVDIQATILRPGDWSQVRLFNRVDRFSVGADIQHSEDKTYGRLYTVYIGSKKSDRFVRVYEKPVDGAVCLRFELQLSHGQAESFGMKWHRGRISEQNVFSGALEWCGDKKLEDTFRSIVEGYKGMLPPYVRKETDTDKWLLETVLPVLGRRLFAHDASDQVRDYVTRLVEKLQGSGMEDSYDGD